MRWTAKKLQCFLMKQANEWMNKRVPKGGGWCVRWWIKWMLNLNVKRKQNNNISVNCCSRVGATEREEGDKSEFWFENQSAVLRAHSQFTNFESIFLDFIIGMANRFLTYKLYHLHRYIIRIRRRERRTKL